MRKPPERKLADRRPGSRTRPTFDRLEARIALSGSTVGSLLGDLLTPPVLVSSPSPTLSVVSTSPSNSAVLTASPTTLLVTFDRPIDPFSVNQGDFSLVHVASDGTTSPMKPGEALISEDLDSTDPTGSRIVLTLSKGLLQGHYRLLLSPLNQLQGLDGTSISTSGSSSVLSDFNFSTPQQSGIGTATQLGTLGSIETISSGSLDLATNPGAVQYYQFTVAPGHHWLVGLEITSHSDGGSLDTSLSLFDSTGHLIATRSQGLSSDPGDPFLFKGLDPGTYYVGVAAQKNIPNASGVYDPSSEGLATGATGGGFRLHLVADPADQPVNVLGVRLDHADPVSNNATGLTLQFSGAIDPSSLQLSTGPALVLVDSSGVAWPLTPTGYDASQAQLSLAFNQAIPAGSYKVELTSPTSLLDLAGLEPVAAGLPGGVLGNLVVTASKAAAGDLGPIYPGFAASGLESKPLVTPGRAVNLQFEVIEPGVYAIAGVTPASGVRFTITDALGNILAIGPNSTGTGAVDVSLFAGHFNLTLTSNGLLPSSISLVIRLKGTQASSLLDTGVAQGPALSLRLVNPQSGFGQGQGSSTTSTTSTAQTAAPTVPTTPAAPTGSSSPGRASDAAPTVAVGATPPTGSSIAGLVFGIGPSGQFGSQSNSIGVVGTTGSSGLAAVASNTPGLPSGLMAVPVSIDSVDLEPAAPPLDPAITALPPKLTQSGITLESGLLARAPGSRLEDDRTLADADWIGEIVGNAMDWFGSPNVEAAAPAVASPSALAEMPADSSNARYEENRIESASMTSPMAIGVALGMIAFRYRKVLEGLSRRAKPLPKVKKRMTLAGPHRRTRVRVR